MKALVFGSPRDPNERTPPVTDEVDELIVGLPFGLHELEDARPLRPDWVVTRPILAGICGSDSKLVLGDFSEGDMDNPMSAFSSLPHVPGHEVVAEVVELGPEAQGVDVGDRVVINPWLTCAPRGISPPCPACANGDLTLCWNFTSGAFGPGVHIGVITDVPGAWAERLSVHDSMVFKVPGAISNPSAVLADPFSVSFHAIVRNPPPPGGRAVIYGAGALGLTSVAILRALYPDVELAVVARFPAQADMARQFGAGLVLDHEPREDLLDELASWSGGVLHKSLFGLPMTRPGGIDVVYDTIGKAETFEVAVRVLAERGALVYSGVATPQRWEWTPVYFKELTVTGSNAFGIEELGGVRKHAMAHYFDLVADGRIDVSAMLTHQFGLDQWWDALRAVARPGGSGALKVAFQPSRSPNYQRISH
jgi:threonine dehydrogenase-like Zn-dependent dehydrogenase